MQFTRTETQSPIMRGRTLRAPGPFGMRSGQPDHTEIRHLHDELERAIAAADARLGLGKLTGYAGQNLRVANPNADATFIGQELIPAGWAQAKMTTATGIANTDIEWRAVQPGEAGNAITVRYIQGVGTAVGYAAGVVTVEMDFLGGGDTAANVLTALAASATGAQYVVQAAHAHGSSGAGTITAAMAATALTGGVGKAMRRATLTTAMAGANNDLTLLARRFGAGEKTVYFSIVDLASADPPTVAVTEGATDVQVVVSAKIGTSTATQVIKALRDSVDAMAWLSVRVAQGNTGAGTVAALTATALADGGEGAGAEAWAAGVAGSIQSITDTGIVVDWPALATLSNNNVCVVRFRIGNAVYEMSVPVVT